MILIILVLLILSYLIPIFLSTFFIKKVLIYIDNKKQGRRYFFWLFSIVICFLAVGFIERICFLIFDELGDYRKLYMILLLPTHILAMIFQLKNLTLLKSIFDKINSDKVGAITLLIMAQLILFVSAIKFILL